MITRKYPLYRVYLGIPHRGTLLGVNPIGFLRFDLASLNVHKPTNINKVWFFLEKMTRDCKRMFVISHGT